MNQESKQLLDQFEKEVWLYLDGDLPEDKMNFWHEKMNASPELMKFVDDYKIISESYQNISEIDIGKDVFNSMIDKTIKRKSFIDELMNLKDKLLNTNSEFAFGKIAFATVLIIAAVIISLLSNRSNPVVNLTNNINSEILDWDAGFFDDQLYKVGTLLKVTRDEDYRKYYKYKHATKDVDKNLDLININIELLKEEIKNEEL